MAGWHHRLNGHEFKQAPGVSDGQGGLACCSPWGHKESDITEQLTHTHSHAPNTHTYTHAHTHTHTHRCTHTQRHTHRKIPVDLPKIFRLGITQRGLYAYLHKPTLNIQLIQFRLQFSRSVVPDPL